MIETGDEPGLLPRVKRFRELWLADPGVRRHPEPAAGALGLRVEALAPLWRADAGGAAPEAAALREITVRGVGFLAFTDDDGGAQDVYRRWRARQKARSSFAQGNAPLNVHAPFCVELTKGCSLGCWFCGLSAAPLDQVLPTDLEAWRDMLDALHGLLGQSGQRGFLYWATDPLDHPDYESYGGVFRTVFGRFPATTTAAALVSLERTRRLIATARAGKCPALRFSVVSLRQLAALHSAFSAEELADVELLPVNRESALELAQSGRMRVETGGRRAKRPAREDNLTGWDVAGHATIACVSGFLVEPVDGLVRLISPEPSSDRWPDGYAVFGEARYHDPAGFRQALNDLTKRYMGSEPPRMLALQRGVEVRSRSPRTVVAAARGHEAAFTTHWRRIDHLPALATAFRGGAPVVETANAVARRFGLKPQVVRRDVVDLWRQGVLIETLFDLAEVAARPAPDSA